MTAYDQFRVYEVPPIGAEHIVGFPHSAKITWPDEVETNDELRALCDDWHTVGVDSGPLAYESWDDGNDASIDRGGPESMTFAERVNRRMTCNECIDALFDEIGMPVGIGEFDADTIRSALGEFGADTIPFPDDMRKTIGGTVRIADRIYHGVSIPAGEFAITAVRSPNETAGASTVIEAKTPGGPYWVPIDDDHVRLVDERDSAESSESDFGGSFP